jgi:drug/metabolite transporter (DMT)-like permease
LSSKDGIVKTIVSQVTPIQIVWIQFVGVFLVMALISMPKHGVKVFWPSSPGAQFIRGALNVGAVLAFFGALKYIPIADATAMMLFAPIVATIASPFLLGEKIGIMRVSAAVFGFFGVLVILRPGFAGDSTGYYFGFAAGIMLGLTFIANRKLGETQPFLLNITYNALMGSLALTPLVILLWEPIPATANLMLVFIVILSVVGQGCMISSFKFGPAAVISPYFYTALIFAALIGYLVFGDIPDTTSWIGMALIVGSGLYIAHRERRMISKN